MAYQKQHIRTGANIAKKPKKATNTVTRRPARPTNRAKKLSTKKKG